MKTRRLRHLVLVCVPILVINQSYCGTENKHLASSASGSQNELAWFPFVPADEEFTAMIPARTTVLVRSSNYLIRKDGERVLADRAYGGYGTGLIFIIESYKAAHPQKLWGPLLENTDKSAVFERDLAFDGVTARQYRSDYSSSYAKYTRRIVRFMTKEHVYFLTLTTLEETNPSVEQFLSSFRLRRPEDRVTPYATQSSEYILGYAFSHTEVTRKAIIVWKPEPTYTDQARAHQVVGTVILQAIFAEDGYVANITVIKEMRDGLTERAIDVTRNIRFFPAEKDGKPVSQQMRLEYNFSLF
jgi:TonB family protein